MTAIKIRKKTHIHALLQKNHTLIYSLQALV